jgi:hypothetical protein
MAEKAILVKSDGSLVPVTANELTSADAGEEYRCCWKNRHGELCGCRMSLAICRQKNNYFRELPGEHHIPFCVYDETDAGSKVSHLSQSTDKNLDELYQLINKQKAAKKNESSQHDGAERGAHQKREDIQDEDDSGPIGITKRDPKNAIELYNLLTRLDDDDEYAGILVKDILYDDRNRRRIKEEGIPSEQPVMILTHRASIKDNPELSRILNGKMVMKYCFHTGTDEPIYFAFDSDRAVRNQIINKDASGRHFAIFGKWERSTQYPSLYISKDIITKNTFTVVPS